MTINITEAEISPIQVDIIAPVVQVTLAGAATGGGGGGVSDHSLLTGLSGDDHPQYLKPVEVLAGANVTVDRTTTPGSVIIASTGSGGGGTSDHHALTNLTAFDDHTQYYNQTRGDARYQQITGKNAASGYAGLDGTSKLTFAQIPTGTTSTTVSLGNHTHTQAQSHGTPDTDSAPSALHHTLGTGANQAAAGNHSHTLDALSDVSTSGATDGQSLVFTAGSWSPATVSSGGGVTDHGLLTGLSDDDHPQYHNNTRGDARYESIGTSTAAANTAVSTHVGLADPHTQYLRTSEIVAGTAISLDTATTPGSVIINSTVTTGPEGPIGPPGGSYLSAQWTFNQTTTAAPNSGTMRLNSTTYAGTTLVWIHEVDRDGLDRSAGLNLIDVGDQIMMQSPQGRAVFNVTAISDDGVYRTATVTVAESLGSRPNASATVTVYIMNAQIGSTVQDEGTPLVYRDRMNFVGAGVTATDDSANSRTLITIPGATGGVPTTRNLTAGTGLTGGGDLSADRTFNVGAGTGITVAADTVAADIGTSATQVAAGNHTHTQAQSHNTPDTDTATTSLHHTIGTSATQAAAGNHTHTQAQSHGSPDTDSATTSLHHTIGSSATQAAAGNHAHTGTYWGLWTGTQAAYDALGTYVATTLYVIA